MALVPTDWVALAALAALLAAVAAALHPRRLPVIVHATADDLAAQPWQVTDSNAAVLLRVASRLVDAATLTAVYAVDDAGRATDPGVLAALRGATCAQASLWAALSIDPLKGAADDGGKAAVASKSIGGATISYDRSGAQAAAAARQAAATTLCSEAHQILADARLTSGQVWLRG